mmetsp:Transcript_21035/g.58523  ORF Transcript_21035/g.58523 Transcript_21035/m.58523 type:complete len:212 (+) Transcript_21035:268-903(+)
MSSASVRNNAISTAVLPQSYPWLLSPLDRAFTCSSFRQFSTPYTIGVEVCSPTLISPLAVASEMYSKCMVSPLIKTPAVTMASTVWLSAKNRAAMGNSKLPGTSVSKMKSSFTLHSFNALRQPSTRLLTCSSFHRVRMMPMRTLEPSKSPNETSLSAAFKADAAEEEESLGAKADVKGRATTANKLRALNVFMIAVAIAIAIWYCGSVLFF